MSFTVQPNGLRRVGKDFLTLADGVARASEFTNAYLEVRDTEGIRLADIGARVNDLRDFLAKEYAPSGDAWVAYHGFGEAIHALARDYERTDQAEAARYDRLMPEASINPAELPDTLQPRTIGLAELTKDFGSAPYDFQAFDVYNGIVSKVDKLLKLDVQAKVLTVAGVADVIEAFKKEVEGDWKQVGRAVGALRTLSQFWYRLEDATRATPNSFEGTWIGDHFHRAGEPGGQVTWSGRAANAATRHLFDLAGKAGDHYDVLENKANAISLQMFVVYDLVDQGVGYAESLAAWLPAGSSTGQQIKDFFDWEKLGPRIVELLKLAAKLLRNLRWFVDAAAAVTSIFSELLSLGTPDFPQVSYALPDVNGPAA